MSADERVKSWRKISRRRRIVARRVEEVVALQFADLSSQRADATCEHSRKIKVAAAAILFSFLSVAACVLKEARAGIACEGFGWDPRFFLFPFQFWGFGKYTGGAVC